VRSQDRVRGDGNDNLVFYLSKRGASIGEFDGHPTSFGPGQVALFDHGRPFNSEGTDPNAEYDNVTLTIARAHIAAHVPRVADLHGFVFNGVAGRLIADHIMMLMRRLPHLTMDHAPAIIRATNGLLASCVTEAQRLEQDDVSARDIEIRNRVGNYIDRNLDMPGLTAEKICDDLGLSRSVLYRAFEPLAGVADYIRARRLEAAHIALENPQSDLKISGTARDVGFPSEAHFSRAFKQRYGYSPRHARPKDAAELDDLTAIVDSTTAPDIFKTWIARLG
jgi:AraC-like DNA-binding protein